MDYGFWLNNNPSGYDHHDPQQTIEDFYEWLDMVNEYFVSDFHLD